MDVTDIRKKEEGRKKKEEGRKPFDTLTEFTRSRSGALSVVEVSKGSVQRFAQGTKKEEKNAQLIGKIMFWVYSCFLILS